MKININSPRLLPNRSQVVWGTHRIALGAWLFHGNTFNFICWLLNSQLLALRAPFEIFLGSSLEHNSQLLIFTDFQCQSINCHWLILIIIELLIDWFSFIDIVGRTDTGISVEEYEFNNYISKVEGWKGKMYKHLNGSMHEGKQ